MAGFSISLPSMELAIHDLIISRYFGLRGDMEKALGKRDTGDDQHADFMNHPHLRNKEQRLFLDMAS